MTEPAWMPTYEIEFWEAGFRNRLLDRVTAKAGTEAGAVEEAGKALDAAWVPGPRKQRRARPLVAVVFRTASGASEEVGRLKWTIDGVVPIRA